MTSFESRHYICKLISHGCHHVKSSLSTPFVKSTISKFVLVRHFRTTFNMKACTTTVLHHGKP
jgi:hypothetical protein